MSRRSEDLDLGIVILLAVLKMGWISNFLSESVLTGFIFGIGIDVVVGQLKKITGTTEPGDNTWQKLISWIQSLPDTNVPTLVLGVSMIIMLVLLHRYGRKVPGALVAVVLGIGLATVFPLAEMGVKLTGPVPSGLPAFVLPSLSFITENLAVILPAAIGVLLVGFSESLAATRQYASKYRFSRLWREGGPDLGCERAKHAHTLNLVTNPGNSGRA